MDISQRNAMKTSWKLYSISPCILYVYVVVEKKTERNITKMSDHRTCSTDWFVALTGLNNTGTLIRLFFYTNMLKMQVIILTGR